MVREVGLKMAIRRKVMISVSPEFRNILKVESALKGKSILELTRDIAGKDNFVSVYIEELNDRRKRDVKKGFKFNF